MTIRLGIFRDRYRIWLVCTGFQISSTRTWYVFPYCSNSLFPIQNTSNKPCKYKAVNKKTLNEISKENLKIAMWKRFIIPTKSILIKRTRFQKITWKYYIIFVLKVFRLVLLLLSENFCRHNNTSPPFTILNYLSLVYNTQTYQIVFYYFIPGSSSRSSFFGISI